jgi:hypothetical protein
MQLAGATVIVVAVLTSVTNFTYKVNELKRLERALSAMVTQCRGDDASDCPILDALAT